MAEIIKLTFLALILFTLFAGCPGDKVGPAAPDFDEEPVPLPPVEERPTDAAFEGRVLIDGKGVPGIIVMLTSELLSSPRTDTTNGRGFYFFENLVPGPYTVTIRGVPPDVRFDTLSQGVDVDYPPDIRLEPQRGPRFEGFRDATVDVLIFLDNAYPAARFLKVEKESGCDAPHWHSRDPVPLIAMREESGTGFECAASTGFRKADPAGRGCGHGKVTDVARESIILDGSCLDAYINMWGPLAP